MTGTQGWNGILDPGEEVLWQGQPDASPDFRGLRVGTVAFGLVAVAFAVFWTAMAAQIALEDGGAAWLMVLPGLAFIVVGGHRAGGAVLWDVYRRKRTWYSLSNRRAFVATNLLGTRDLAAYPITPQTVLDHDGRWPGNIWFATDYVKTRRGSRKQKIGFERLADSGEVMDLMLKIQRQEA